MNSREIPSSFRWIWPLPLINYFSYFHHNVVGIEKDGTFLTVVTLSLTLRWIQPFPTFFVQVWVWVRVVVVGWCKRVISIKHLAFLKIIISNPPLLDPTPRPWWKSRHASRQTLQQTCECVKSFRALLFDGNERLHRRRLFCNPVDGLATFGLVQNDAPLSLSCRLPLFRLRSFPLRIRSAILLLYLCLVCQGI